MWNILHIGGDCMSKEVKRGCINEGLNAVLNIEQKMKEYGMLDMDNIMQKDKEYSALIKKKYSQKLQNGESEIHFMSSGPALNVDVKSIGKRVIGGITDVLNLSKNKHLN